MKSNKLDFGLDGASQNKYNSNLEVSATGETTQTKLKTPKMELNEESRKVSKLQSMTGAMQRETQRIGASKAALAKIKH